MPTIEEVRQGIAADPTLKTAILTEFDAELPEYLKGKGFIVRTSADDESEFEKRLSPKVKELYGGLEKDVLDTFTPFGITKENNTEKVYELIKKAGTKISEKIKALETDLETAKKGKVDDVTAAEITAYKAEIETLKGQKSDLEKDFNKKLTNFKIGKEFDKAFAELKIALPLNIAEKDKADYVKNQIDLLSSAVSNKYAAEEKDGRIIYKDAEGNIQMNGTEVATAKDLLLRDHKYQFEAVKKGGSGSGGGDEEDKPTIVKDKVQLYAQLSKEGLTQGSAAWLERGQVLAEANKIDWEFKKKVEDKK